MVIFSLLEPILTNFIVPFLPPFFITTSINLASPEKGKRRERDGEGEYHEKLAHTVHTVMEAKSHDLPSATRRPRKASGVIRFELKQ